MERKPGTFTSRTKARKRAVDVVFEAQQRGILDRTGGLSDLLAERRMVSTAQTPLPPYAVQIVQGIADNIDRIDQLLNRRAKVSGLDRLPGVDLAVLRVAVWEMLANSDVDDIVAIDEAVAIVKSISTDRSPAFVNAVLDAIRRDLTDEGKVEKSIPNREEDRNISLSREDIDELTELDELLDEY